MTKDNSTKDTPLNKTIDQVFSLQKGYTGWVIGRIAPLAVSLFNAQLIDLPGKKNAIKTITFTQLISVIRMIAAVVVLAIIAPKTIYMIIQNRNEFKQLTHDDILELAVKGIENDVLDSNLLSDKTVGQIAEQLNENYIKPTLLQVTKKLQNPSELKIEDKNALEKDEAQLKFLKKVLEKSPSLYKVLTKKDIKEFLLKILQSAKQQEQGDIYEKLFQSFVAQSVRLAEEENTLNAITSHLDELQIIFKELIIESYEDIQLFSNVELPAKEAMPAFLDNAFILAKKLAGAMGSDEKAMDELKPLILTALRPSAVIDGKEIKKEFAIPKLSNETITNLLNALGNEEGIKLVTSIIGLPMLDDIIQRFNFDGKILLPLSLIMKDEKVRENLMKETKTLLAFATPKVTTENQPPITAQALFGCLKNIVDISTKFFRESKELDITLKTYKEEYAPIIANTIFGALRELDLMFYTRNYTHGNTLVYLEYLAQEPERLSALLGIMEELQKEPIDKPKMLQYTKVLSTILLNEGRNWTNNNDVETVEQLNNIGVNSTLNLIQGATSVMRGVGAAASTVLGVFTNDKIKEDNNLAKAADIFLRTLNDKSKTARDKNTTVKISEIINHTVSAIEQSTNFTGKEKNNIIKQLKLGYFHNIEFNGELNFSNVKFDRHIDFDTCRFMKKVDLSGCDSQEGKLRFHYPQFQEKVKLNLEQLNANKYPVAENSTNSEVQPPPREHFFFLGYGLQKNEVLDKLMKERKLEVNSNNITTNAKNEFSKIIEKQPNITETIASDIKDKKDYYYYEQYLSSEVMKNVDMKLLAKLLQNESLATILIKELNFKDILEERDNKLCIPHEIQNFLNICNFTSADTSEYLDYNHSKLTNFRSNRTNTFINGLKKCQNNYASLMGAYNQLVQKEGMPPVNSAPQKSMTPAEFIEALHFVMDIINAGPFSNVNLSEIITEIIQTPELGKQPTELAKLVTKHSQVDKTKEAFDQMFYQELVKVYKFKGEYRDKVYQLYSDKVFSKEQIKMIFSVSLKSDNLSEYSMRKINQAILTHLNDPNLVFDPQLINKHLHTICEALGNKIQDKIQDQVIKEKSSLVNQVWDRAASLIGPIFGKNSGSSRTSIDISFNKSELHEILKPAINFEFMSLSPMRTLKEDIKGQHAAKLNLFFEQQNKYLLMDNYHAVTIQLLNDQLCTNTVMEEIINKKASIEEKDLHKLENTFKHIISQLPIDLRTL